MVDFIHLQWIITYSIITSFFVDSFEEHNYPHGCFYLHYLKFPVFFFHFPSCNRTVSAAEGSGHSSREELAGDLGERGDHDGSLFPESLPGSGQDEGGTNYHRL